MIKIISPLKDSLTFNSKITVEYEVTENSKFTSKVVFFVDDTKIEKTELKGSFQVSNILEGKHYLRCYLINQSNKIIIGSETDFVFYTNDDVITIKNKLSSIVKNQIPSFIREDYDNFVSFIQKYYEFLETSNDPKLVPFTSADFFDVDKTSTFFIDRFRKIFIPDFPAELTIDKETGRTINLSTLIKRAKDFYESKGTKNSINFIFRILYDEDVEFYYPREHLFIASGGNWIEKKSLKFFVTDKDRARALVGNVIYQKVNQAQTAQAKVLSCTIQKQSPYTIAEIELSEIVGQFSDSVPLYCDIVYQDAKETVQLTLKRGIGSIEITSSGYNYQVGDRVTLEINTNSVGGGVGYIGKVSKVTALGQIQEIQSINFGVNFEQNSEAYYNIIIDSLRGTGFVGSPQSTVLMRYEGYYGTTNGVLSERSFIQDNDYYQTHSYEISSSVNPTKYYDTVKRLAHPAGYKLFGNLILKDELTLVEQEKTNLNRIASYYIGNFLAYRINGDVNLRSTFLDGNPTEDLFPNGFNHEQPVPPDTDGYFIHDPQGNPEARNIDGANYGNLDFLFPFVSDADQKYNYWVQFPHPNTLINTNEFQEQIKDLRIVDLAVIDLDQAIIGDEF